MEIPVPHSVKTKYNIRAVDELTTCDQESPDETMSLLFHSLGILNRYGKVGLVSP